MRTFVFGAASMLAASLALAAPVPTLPEEKAPDREGFIPQRKYQSVPGRAIGVMVSDVGKIMGNEGRGGPQDAMAFSAGGGSYRWVYTPANPGASLIQNLQVKVGAKGEETRIYPALNMASPTTVKELWGITTPYALVEVEVNDKQGAPADESFVGSKMTQLDGTRDYPIKVAEAVEQTKKRWAMWQANQKDTLDAAMLKAQKQAIGDGKATGPRETNEMMHVSWMPDSERLRIRFRVKMTDGAYQQGGGIDERRDPPALPVVPKGGFKLKQPVQPQAPVQGQVQPQAEAVPVQAQVQVQVQIQGQVQVQGGKVGAIIRPPIHPGFRYGKQFGIEYGVSYEIDKTGNVAKIQVLPPETFQAELPPPPGIGRGRPIPLPVPVPPQPVDR